MKNSQKTRRKTIKKLIMDEIISIKDGMSQEKIISLLDAFIMIIILIVVSFVINIISPPYLGMYIGIYYAIPGLVPLFYAISSSNKYTLNIASITSFVWAFFYLKDKVIDFYDGFFYIIADNHLAAIYGVGFFSAAMIVMGTLAASGGKRTAVKRQLGDARTRSPRNHLGDARFATPAEIHFMSEAEDGGLILGEIGHADDAARLAGMKPKGRGFGGELVRWHGEGNLLTIAPPGTGKTTSVAIPTLLTCENPIVVLDVKGELYRITSRYRKEIGHKVHAFSPDSKFGIKSVHINPMDYIRTDDDNFDIDCRRLTEEVIEKENESGSGKFFTEAATAISAALVALLKDADERDEWPFVTWPSQVLEIKIKNIIKRYEENKIEINMNKIEAEASKDWPWKSRPEANLSSVSDILNAPKEALNGLFLYIQIQSDLIGLGSITARNGAALWNGSNEKTQGDILSTAQNFFTLFSYPAVKKIISDSNIDLSEITNSKNILDLYIVIPDDKIETYKSVIKMILFSVIISVKKREKRPKKDILFLLDEMPALGKVESILSSKGAGALTIGRGQGLKFWFIAQSLGQIKQIYGKENTQTILSAAVLQVFNIPASDNETKSYISDALGAFTAVVESTGASATNEKGMSLDVSKGKSVNVQDQARKLLEPDEVAKLPADSQLIFINSGGIEGGWPILCKKTPYFTRPEWKELCDN